MNDNDQILFEKYFNDAMSTSESSAFRQRLESDESLRGDYELYCEMQTFLSSRQESSNAIKILKEVHQENTKDTPGNKAYFILALVLIAIAFALLYILNIKKQVKQKPAFAALYDDGALWPDARGASGTMDSLLLAYKKSGDQTAVEKIKQQKSIPANSRYYWLSEIYTYEQQVDSSLKYIRLAHSNNPGLYRDRLFYLEGLAYYQQENTSALDSLQSSLPDDLDKYYRNLISRIEL